MLDIDISQKPCIYQAFFMYAHTNSTCTYICKHTHAQPLRSASSTYTFNKFVLPTMGRFGVQRARFVETLALGI